MVLEERIGYENDMLASFKVSVPSSHPSHAVVPFKHNGR